MVAVRGTTSSTKSQNKSTAGNIMLSSSIFTFLLLSVCATGTTATTQNKLRQRSVDEGLHDTRNLNSDVSYVTRLTQASANADVNCDNLLSGTGTSESFNSDCKGRVQLTFNAMPNVCDGSCSSVRPGTPPAEIMEKELTNTLAAEVQRVLDQNTAVYAPNVGMLNDWNEIDSSLSFYSTNSTNDTTTATPGTADIAQNWWDTNTLWFGGSITATFGCGVNYTLPFEAAAPATVIIPVEISASCGFSISFAGGLDPLNPLSLCREITRD